MLYSGAISSRHVTFALTRNLRNFEENAVFFFRLAALDDEFVQLLTQVCVCVCVCVKM
jgi:hypothetical protein